MKEVFFLTAFILIEENPYAIDLHIEPQRKPIKTFNLIKEQVAKEIESEDFELIYAKYKYLQYRNIELYTFFKLRYYREPILAENKNNILKYGAKGALSVLSELLEEQTENFDNILIKYGFEQKKN